ncbi:MAG: tetratricopeptide repeat protein [Bacteroidales bacterium]
MNLRWVLYIFIIVIIQFGNVYTQDQIKIDSLIRSLSEQDDKEEKVLNYYTIVFHLIKQNIDSALRFANEGLYLAKKLDYDYGIAQLHAAIGDINVVQNNLVLAMDNYQKSISYYVNAGIVNDLGKVYLVIGNIYFTQANYPAALEFYQKGLVITDSLNMTTVVHHFYNNLGELNTILNHYDDAIVNYKKALEINEDLNDSLAIALILTNLCNVYIILDDVATARNYLEKARKIYKGTSNKIGLHTVFTIMGDIEKNQDNCEDAIEHYKQAFNYLENIGSDYLGPKSILYADIYNRLGFCYLQLNQYFLAEQSLLKGYKIASETGLLDALTKITINLSDVYENTNKPARSLEFFKLFKQYSDSISKEENVKKITQLGMQFEFDKMMKERELEDLRYKQKQKRKELLYLSIIGGSILSLILLGMLLTCKG